MNTRSDESANPARPLPGYHGQVVALADPVGNVDLDAMLFPAGKRGDFAPGAIASQNATTSAYFEVALYSVLSATVWSDWA